MNARRIFVACLVVPTLFCLAPSARSASGEAFPVKVEVDASTSRGDLHPIWRFFGADEPNYAYMKDGRKLLAALGQLGTPQVYFRTHNLLNTGDGAPALKWGSTNAYTEDAQGRPLYDWTIVDRIFDTYLQRGLKPYAQIGFMPQALSVKPEPYQHEWRPGLPYSDVYTGWAHPPKDYGKWAELVHRWVAHSVDKYGRAEVEQWYWEVWNEPNIAYWQGTPEEFRKLHDYAVDAVRRALPTARVGGPDTAGGGGQFLRDFLEHCLRGTNHATGAKGTPLDFIAFHAKGQPTYVDGHVQMGIARHLQTIDGAMAIVASFPELRRKPIVIGESDPEGCAACQGPQLGYRNGTMYSSYTAASFARKHDLAEKHGVNLEGALTWAFEFEDQPYFAGFRALASNGIDLPVLNVFRMFGKMGGRRLAVKSSGEVPLDAMVKDGVRGTPDVSALASLEGNRLSVVLWHYHDDDLPGPDAAVTLAVSGLPVASGDARLTHFRIDDGHSNAYAAWKRMGSPIAPNADQYKELQAASQLARLDGPATVGVRSGKASLDMALPRQAVSLVVLEW
jgi:xylan 1,4-beta-xylosidase